MADTSNAVVVAGGQKNSESEGCVTCIVTDDTLLNLNKFTKTLPGSTTVSSLYDEVANEACLTSGTFFLAHVQRSGQEAEETMLDKLSLLTLRKMSGEGKRVNLVIKPRDGQVPVLSRTGAVADDAGSMKDGSWKELAATNTSTASTPGPAQASTASAAISYSTIASRATTRGDYAGLVNQAMTCYLNSVLQTQFMTAEFRNAIYNWQYIGGPDEEETSIPFQLQKLFATMQTSQKRAVKTVDVTKSFGWTNADAWQQHDVQELCRVMFDALEKSFKGTAQDELIKQLYEGTMQDYVKCLACSHESTRSDTYMDISLVIKPFGSTKTCGSVEEALQVHVTPETLDGTNQYFCEKCNSKQDAHKGLKFLTFPYLLTLQLKRFDFDYRTMHRIKLNDRMTFPSMLDLNGFIAKQGDECEVVRRQSISLGTPVDRSRSFGKRTETATADAGTPTGLSSVSEGGDADGTSAPAVAAAAAAAATRDTEAGTGNVSEPDYVYELLSIMVHSGSAIGGHYYAYIRSIETNKWYSFNDSNVTAITVDDIKKTFGGGGTTSSYSSMYSSSANAYMLIYRRMDPERNSKFLHTDEFPPHIMRLVKAVEEQEELERQQVETERSHCRIPVFYRSSESGEVVKKVLNAKNDIPFREAIDIARNLHGLDDIPVERCRLVKYDENYDSCECSYENREDEQLGHLLGGIRQTYLFDLLLETRAGDEVFEVYLPNSSTLKVYGVDVAQSAVSPTYHRVRALLSWTVQDVLNYLEKKVGFPASKTRLVVHKYTADISLLNPERTLSNEGFYRSAVVYAEPSLGAEEGPFKATKLCTVLTQHLNTIKWHVTLPPMSFDDDETADGDAQEAKVSSPSPRVFFVEFDRRLTVADFKRHLEQYLGGVTSQCFRLYKKLQNGQELEIFRLADPMSFHAEYEILVHLGRAVGVDEYRVPVYFFDRSADVFMTSLGDIIAAKGMIVAKLRELILELCKEIVAAPPSANEVRHKAATAMLEAPAETLRLRKKNYKTPSAVLLSQLQIGRDLNIHSGWEVAAEVLEKPDTYCTNHTAIFVRRWNPSSYTFGPIQEIVVPNVAMKTVKASISQLSGIPIDQVDLAKALGFFPFHYSPLEVQDLAWNPKVPSLDRIPVSIYEDGSLLYYRDGKETPEELTAERRREIERQETTRSSQLNRNSSTVTYRKERALKIKTSV